MNRPFPFRELTPARVEEIAQQFEEQGYILLSGLDGVLPDAFRPVLEQAIGVSTREFSEILDPTVSDRLFPKELRRKVARVQTTDKLAGTLLEALQPILQKLIGPLVQVSRDFHAQFKGDFQGEVIHGGYAADADYMEVHRPYMLHQDFTGASLPTSPSALTLWTGLNPCSCWNLRLYPRSHQQGLICQRWLPLDDERLQALEKPVDIQAMPGSAILFNALLLHGTSNPGPLRRVSCDIRFFPLCPFLASDVHMLDPEPLRAIQKLLDRAPGPTLRSALLEDRHFLGTGTLLPEVPRNSVLNWSNFVFHAIRNEQDEARRHLENFVNAEIGADRVDVYASKFCGVPPSGAALDALRKKLAEVEPNAPELSRLETLLEDICSRSNR